MQIIVKLYLLKILYYDKILMYIQFWRISMIFGKEFYDTF